MSSPLLFSCAISSSAGRTAPVASPDGANQVDPALLAGSEPSREADCQGSAATPYSSDRLSFALSLLISLAYNNGLGIGDDPRLWIDTPSPICGTDLPKK